MSNEAARLMQRTFLDAGGVEVEICTDASLGKHYVRHHLYWKVAHGQQNPDPVKDCIIPNLDLMSNKRLSTIRWVGYRFAFETVNFVDDTMTIEAVMLPLAMFEEFMRYHYQERMVKGTTLVDDCTKLGAWLGSQSLLPLLNLAVAESFCLNPLSWLKRPGV